jgi:long-chain fatty acid transport protein
MDSQATASGNAYVATADSPSAVYYNPAGLGLLSQPNVDLMVYVVTPTDSYQPLGGGASEHTSPQTFVEPSLFVAAPIGSYNNSPVTLGIGFYSPFGQSTSWPEEGSFRDFATHNKITYETGAVSCGFTPFQHVLVGASIEVSNNRTDLNRALGYNAGDFIHFAGSDTAPSYNIGVLWQPTPQHSFGVSYQAETHFNLDGTVTMSAPVSQSFSDSVHWVYPDDLNVGYSYRPTAEWNIEVNYDWTNWQKVKTVISSKGIEIPLDWKASAYTSLGVTYQPLQSRWLYSIGAQYSPNSVPDSVFSPSLPDVSKWLYSAGLGYKLTTKWKIILLGQVSPQVSRAITTFPNYTPPILASPMLPSGPGPATESANGTYSTGFWAFGITLRTSF